METPGQREQRIADLERRRQSRRGGTAPSPQALAAAAVERPIQIAPGRGDLSRTITGAQTYPLSLWTVGGRPVSFAKLFMTQPWVAAAVNRLLGWAVRVPLKVYERQGDDPADRRRLRPGEHPLADCIDAQDGRSAAQLTMQLLGPLLVHGNSVTRCESGAGESIRLTAKDWRYCRPVMPHRDQIAGWEFDIDDPITSVAAVDNVLHIASWSPDGPLGCSPLQQLGVTLQIEDAAQRFIRATFANGARPPSAVTTSDAFLGLEPPERQQLLDQLRKDLTDVYAGPDQAGKPALLPPGLDWKQVGHTTVEAALVEQRQVNREEIAGVYMVPGPLIGDLTRGTYSNVESLKESAYTDCLGPPLVLIEQAINAQIVKRLLRQDDVFVEHDFGAVLRGDRAKEIAALRDAISSALMTPNEGRQILNMPKSDSPAMGQFFMPVNNLQPVGSAPIAPVWPVVPADHNGKR